MAPEVRGALPEDHDIDSYTEVIDIWAIGIILHELLTTFRPFPSLNVLEQFCRGRINSPVTKLKEQRVSQIGITFIESLLNFDLTNRRKAKVAVLRSWLVAGRSRNTTSQRQ